MTLHRYLCRALKIDNVCMDSVAISVPKVPGRAVEHVDFIAVPWLCREDQGKFSTSLASRDSLRARVARVSSCNCAKRGWKP